MSDSLQSGMEWLDDLRQRMLHILLGTLVILGSLGVAASAVRVLRGESARNLPFYLAAYVVAVLLFAVKRLPGDREIPLAWRAYAFLFALYAFGAYSLFSGWLVSGGRTFLVALVVGAAVLVGTRAGFVAALVGLLTYALFGLAYSEGWLELRQLPDPTTPGPIITEGVGFAMVVGIAALGLWLIQRSLSTAIHATWEAQQARELLLEHAQQLDAANRSLAERSQSLEQANAALQERVWFSTAHSRLDDVLRGEHTAQELANDVTRVLCNLLNAQVGALYGLEADINEVGPALQLLGSYAFSVAGARIDISPATRVNLGEGMLGQTARDGTLMHVTGLAFEQAVQERLAQVRSGLGDALPASFLLVPVFSAGQVNGVIELATLEGFNPLYIDFLKNASEKIGATLASAQSRQRIRALLDERA